MNGVHDMGGMQDMGPIAAEKDGPVFHADWERRVFALFNAVDVEWPYRRTQIELIPPAEYLRMSYYEKWLAALPRILIKTGMATAAEVESGNAIGGTNTKWHVLTVAEVATWDAPEPPTAAKTTAPTRLHVGQRVRARNLNPMGHTRLPRYVRGKMGTITRDGGSENLQDTDIRGLGPKQQHVYTVRFAARELWGDQASPRDFVCADLWEGYLESP
ncbi:MAG TPA: nitrile hydratase subunit beta [Steroidobacteraceae bacterium]|nr:nitrile hydratase subunit beta [Steroidobacteraceae bacterium]